MANQVGARLEGDEYQHITSWLHVLELKMPKRAVRSVTVEDESAGSADDLTLRHEPGSLKPDVFYQIKYHVTQGSAYSTNLLLESKPKGTSLLQKLFSTWRILREQEPTREVEIHLVSNWAWDTADKIGTCIDGRTNAFKVAFFESTPKSDIGKLRQRWSEHLQIDLTVLASFARDVRFYLGSSCFVERLQRVSERMENLHLKHDEAALHVAAGIVRTWIMTGRQIVTKDVLERELVKHNLYAKGEDECKVVYLTTIKKQASDLPPDYVLDWRSEFEGDEFVKGHEVKDETVWNESFLPELKKLEAAIAEETGCRLVRVRGLARLSAWMAFGFVFSDVSRYVIELDQNGALWRTDSQSAGDFHMTAVSEDGEDFAGDTATLAVGISISGDIGPAARNHLQTTPLAGKLFLLQPNRPMGRECFRGSEDVVSFVRCSKQLIKQLVDRFKPKTLQIYYYGPLSGACFLGHSLNAIGADVQVMEAQSDHTYRPSFLLK